MTDAAHLARYGFRAPERSLRELPVGWQADDRWPRALAEMGRTADPDAALRRLNRLGPQVRELVLADPVRARGLLAVLGYSDYLTGLCVKTPGLAADLVLGRERPRPDVRSLRDASLAHIAARDLVCDPTRKSFERTGRALADLADRCVALVLDDAIAVMAMGKWGGQELNYASDIDVLFVAPESDGGAEARARRILSELSGPPVIFRVDAGLRPQGRDGPLVRTLEAYRTYYERWAEVWEFQALVKCRFAAGDGALGRAFEGMIASFVWPDRLAPHAVEQIRALKARAEAEVARRGLASVEVKLGSGGIRDVEMAVQLLQLVHGRHLYRLRVRSTLEALDALAAEGLVGEEDAAELAEAYVFLRHVEHRLQLESGRRTHRLPAALAKREHLARGLGFRDTPERSALAAFEERWARTTTVVRTLHERLFYRPLMETFARAPSVGVAMPASEADERLAALGFDHPPRVRRAITELCSGGGRRARLMRAILPAVLGWMAETPEPDAGMIRLAGVASRLDAFPHLVAVLRDEPPVVELMCRILGTGGVLAALLERDPSLVGALGEGPDLGVGERAAALVARAPDAASARTALRRLKEGEVVRLVARDLARGADPTAFLETALGLSEVAEACLEAALSLAAAPPTGFAVVGLGRLGGRELSLASDLDVVFIYEGGERLQHAACAERIVSLLSETPPIFRVDTELRPEGRSGAIIRSLAAYVEYYERWASLWEFQALIRARHVAGDPALTAALLEAVAPRVWRPELGPAEVAEIRRMKARIERERVRVRDDPRFQVKLGVGGLADVEFTVQLLQMRHGHAHPELRTPNTYEAISRLEEGGFLDRRDAAWLRDAYLVLNRVRNHMYLLRGVATDALPSRDEDVERLARSLGWGRLARSRFLEHYLRTTRRARRVTDRVFYGAGGHRS